MSRKAFEAKLEALAALHVAPAAEAQQALATALKDRNGFYVSRAAAMAADLSLATLIPDLLAAYNRFFDDPVKSDPQCWAKIAIGKALHSLSCTDPAPYLQGINHVQFEPVWGGVADSAGPLRSACAVALVSSSLPSLAILTHLAPLLADPDTAVRMEAIKAITHLADPAAAPLLRLKALLSEREPEVLGAALSALLALESASLAVPFIAGFLDREDPDTQLEASCVLAQAADPQALEALLPYWIGPRPTPQIREAILLNLGISPLPAAANLLRQVIDSDAELAAVAQIALASHRSSQG